MAALAFVWGWRRTGANFSVTEIMFAGRWDSLRTLNHYLQEGLAAYAVSCLPQDRRELVQSLVELLPALVAGK